VLAGDDLDVRGRVCCLRLLHRCFELAKLELDLNPAQLIVLPVAKSETPEISAVSNQVLASDFATQIKAK
jgi:hypothetical protein